MLLSNRVKTDSGLALPIVLIVGAVGLLGATTVTIITSQGLFNSIRTQQERQALEIAESGINETIELLNSNYTDLLVNCYQSNSSDCLSKGTWTEPENSYNCPNGSNEFQSRTVSPIPTSQLEKVLSTKPNGSYKILSYNYDGTRFYGGTGILKVEGRISSDDGSQLLSRVVVERTFNIQPTNCPQGEIPTEDNSGFAGICAKSVDLGNNDVYGAVSGNILCTDCEFPEGSSETEEEARELISAGENAVVSGDIFIGGTPCPDIYKFPDELLRDLLEARGLSEDATTDEIQNFINTNTGDLQDYIEIDKSVNKYQITASDAPASGASGIDENKLCITDSGNNADVNGVILSDGEPFTYCLVNNIVLSSNEQLEIDTSSGPVKIYTLGDVNVGGTRSISQVATIGSGENAEEIEPPPFRLGLYGRSIDQCQDIRQAQPEGEDPFEQNVRFSGVSKVKGKGSKDSVETEAKAASVFVHFPCGNVGINGGAQADVDECNYFDPTITVDNYQDMTINTDNLLPYGDCGGGDVRGVVWAETWDGSNSNQAQLVVPPDSPNDAGTNNGVEFIIAVQKFVATSTGFGRAIQ